MVGAGTALNSAGRSNVSSATLISERTTHITLLSLFQTLGFIIGPGVQVGTADGADFLEVSMTPCLQAALTPIGPGDVTAEGGLVFDMYTSTGMIGMSLSLSMFASTGWVSTASGILCFFLYLPCLFKESYISEKELEAIKKVVTVTLLKATTSTACSFPG